MKMKLFILILFVFAGCSAQNQQSFVEPSSPVCTRCAYEEKAFRMFYQLGYDEMHEVAAWTMYMLTPTMAGEFSTDVPRETTFKEDTRLSVGSATSDDYRLSGFDRGHLVPAEDMDFSEVSMEQTFLMSNIAPQVPSFNRGLWKQLEEHVRKLGSLDTIFVYTGTVVPSNRTSIIKDTVDAKGMKVKRTTYVTIPTHFYKVVYSPKHNTYTAWIMPNAAGTGSIEQYEISITALESVAGVAFRLPTNMYKAKSSEALLIQP